MAELRIRARVALGAAAWALSVLACQTELAAVDYKLYPGPVRPATELARIEFGALQLLSIDGLRASTSEWRSIEVAPGRHFVVWDLPSKQGARPDPQAPVHRIPGAWVALEAGHAYRWRRHHDYNRTPSDFVWLQDDATGLVLAGEQP